MPKRVIFVVTNHGELGATGHKTGYYLPEAAHPYNTFHKEGWEVVFASPKGGLSPMDPGSADAFKADPVCTEFLNNSAVQDQLKNTVKISDILAKKPTGFDIVFFVGGHGPTFDLPENEHVQQLIRTIYEENNTNIVAAVCHGPVALTNAKLSDGSYLVANKKVTGFSDAEEEAVGLTSVVPFLQEKRLRERGAKFEKADQLWGPHVVSDQRLFTGQNPASAGLLAEALVKHFK